MLQKLSDKIQGVLAWTILSTVAITFIFFGINYYTQSRTSNDSEMTINNTKVSHEEYMLSYKRLERTVLKNNSSSEINEQQLKKRTMENLIVNHITLQGAQELGFAVSPSQATESIKLIPQFQKDGSFSRKAYQAAINAALYTPISFQQQVQQGMLVNQQKFALMGTQFVLPSEFKEYVGTTQQERKIRYALIPIHDFTPKIEISDKEIKQYYQLNQNNFQEPKKISVEYVLISKSNIKLSAPTPKSIKEYYDENVSSYQSPKKWLIETVSAPDLKQGLVIYNKMKANPDNFNQIAKANKIVPAKSFWISEADKNNSLLNAIEVLDDQDKVSYPVKKGNKYEIVHIIKIEHPQSLPFDKVQQLVIKDWENQQKEQIFDTQLDKISEVSYEYPESLDKIAQEFNLKANSTNLFSSDGEGLGELRDPAFIKAAFSPDVLNSGNNSDVIVLGNGDAVVLRLKEIQMPRILSINDVREQIIKEIKSTKQQKFVNGLLTEVVKKLRHDSKNTLTINKKTYTWKEYTNLNRESENIPADILRCAFDADDINTARLCALSTHAYAIMEVLDVKNGAISDLDAEQQSSIQEQLEANYGINEYEGYINTMIKTAKITQG